MSKFSAPFFNRLYGVRFRDAAYRILKSIKTYVKKYSMYLKFPKHSKTNLMRRVCSMLLYQWAKLKKLTKC